ncbi:uncharacterized protein CG1339 [Drosophila innubila]|uniref:uncharacterized protein CG1339 n=1 Tax=Drosophila innubila TaxID=198719 RepID=UPI00148D2ECE|nr:uncharacterized protein CG1339 [Drosophila innubila]
MSVFSCSIGVMWNTEDIRLLRSGPSNEVYKRIFLYSSWLLYWIARCCNFLKLRYNSHSRRLEHTQYNIIITKLILTVKCLFLLRHIVDYMVIGFVIWIHLFRVEKADGQNFLISLAMQGISINVLRRIVIFLHSQEDCRLIKQLVNEIIYISRTIESKFGMIYHCEFSLLGLYLCKMYLVYLIMETMWYKPYFLWINLFYWILMEYCEFAYFLYQLILLNWYRNLSFFLQSLTEYHETLEFISRHYHRRLLLLFKVHLRIIKLHKYIKEKVAWLPSAIYLGIFTSIFNMELLLECMIYAQDDIENKMYIIADGCLGPALVPLLNVLILGICTDRLRSVELTLQQQIVIINIQYIRKAYQHDNTLKVLHNEHTSLIVHQKLEPLLNEIVFGMICDREFAFDYFLTVMITALSFIQYTVSTNRNVAECVSHK